MWSKIYFAFLGLSVVVMAFFTYYSWSWLQSIGSPASALEGWHFHAKLARLTLLISFAVLLLVGNSILWLTRSAWAMWSAGLYFGSFTLLWYFWLVPAMIQYEKANGPSIGDSWFTPLFGVFVLAVVALGVFLNQLVVVRLQRKMYPPTPVDERAENTTDKDA